MQRKNATAIRGSQFRVRENGLLWGMAGIKLALFMLAGNLYNYNPWEYYTQACSQHIGWGYAEFPPLSVFLYWLVKHTLGTSLYAIRLLPALAGAATVFLTGKLVKDLGGSAFAVGLAGMGMILTPFYLASNNMYSPLAFTPLFSVLALVILVHILDSDRYFFWLPLGLVLALAVLNHYSALAFIPGIFIGLLFTKYREHFFHKEIWFALLLLFCLLLPHLLWQDDHQWPVLQVFKFHLYWQNSPFTAQSFLFNQLLYNHPVMLIISLVGLLVMVLDKRFHDYRLLVYIFVAHFTIFFFIGVENGSSLMAVYPLLIVPGVLFVEQQLVEQSPAIWKPVIMFPLILFGLIILPVCLSVLPANGLNVYVQTLKDYGTGIPALYQGPFLQPLAEQIQTKDWIEQTSAHYQTLSDSGRTPTTIFADNKYLCATIDENRRAFNYQRPVSAHHSWWLWGPGNHDNNSVLYVNDQTIPVHWYGLYEKIAPVDTVTIKGPFFSNKTIYLYHCHSPKKSLGASWQVLKKY